MRTSLAHPSSAFYYHYSALLILLVLLEHSPQHLVKALPDCFLTPAAPWFLPPGGGGMGQCYSGGDHHHHQQHASFSDRRWWSKALAAPTDYKRLLKMATRLLEGGQRATGFVLVTSLDYYSFHSYPLAHFQLQNILLGGEGPRQHSSY